MLRKILCLLLATSSLCRADERSAEEWTKDLKAAYGKLSGFTAIYRAQAEGKSLEVMMGMDEGSGLAALHMMAVKNGTTVEFKQWATDKDELFVEMPGQGRFLVTGLKTEMKSLQELQELLTPLGSGPAAVVPHQSTPVMLLDKTEIKQGVNLLPRDEPSWKGFLEGASVKEAGEKSVSFQTKDNGLLEISREHGILLKQTISREEGTVVLELAELRLNPGGDAVAKISTDWKNDDAKVLARGSMLGALRMMVFNELIRGVEEGRADLEKLGKQLEEQREPLRRFADGFTAEVGGSLAANETWKAILSDIRKAADRNYRKDNPKASDEEVGKFLDAFLGNPANRADLRDHASEVLAKNKELRQLLLFELSGKNRKVKLLSAKDEAGEAAKEMIEIALFRAYAEAVLDKRMQQLWSEREGLE